MPTKDGLSICVNLIFGRRREKRYRTSKDFQVQRILQSDTYSPSSAQMPPSGVPSACGKGFNQLYTNVCLCGALVFKSGMRLREEELESNFGSWEVGVNSTKQEKNSIVHLRAEPTYRLCILYLGLKLLLKG